MKLENIAGDSNNFTISGKTFMIAPVKPTIEFNIFAACDKILRTEYEYEIDGLIFTPENTGVNSNVAGEKSSAKKKTMECRI